MDSISQIIKTESNGGTSTCITLDGKSITCQPGIKIIDSKFLNVARNSGWFISYAQFHDMDDIADIVLDYAEYEAVDKAILQMCTRLFVAEIKREGKEVTYLKTEQKEELAKMILQQIFQQARPEGFLVLRLNRDLPFKGHVRVKEEISHIKKTGTFPPIFVKYSAMEKILRSKNILSEECNKNGMELSFQTASEKSLPSTSSIFGTDFDNLSKKILKMEFETGIIKDDLETFLEKNSVECADQETLNNIVSQLENSIREQIQLRSELETKKIKTNHSHLQVQDYIKSQEEHIISLHKKIEEKQVELNTNNDLLEHLSSEQTKFEDGKQKEVLELTVKIREVEDKLLKVKKERQDMIPLQDTIELEEEKIELQKRKEELEELLRQERFKAKQLKDQFEELSDETATLRNTISELNDSFGAAKRELQLKTAETKTLKTEMSTLEQQIDKIKQIGKLSEVLSEETEIAEEVVSLGSLRLKTRKLPKLEHQDVLGLLDQTKSSVATVAAISHKEVTNLLPKWASGSNASDFVRKVKKGVEVQLQARF